MRATWFQIIVTCRTAAGQGRGSCEVAEEVASWRDAGGDVRVLSPSPATAAWVRAVVGNALCRRVPVLP